VKEGDVITAEVVDVQANGLYLRAEDLSGFVNVLSLTWRPARVDPHDFAKVGDQLRVKVSAVTETGFYASLKALYPAGDPFADVTLYNLGVRHTGRVHLVRPFGVFVELETGAIGLIASAILPRELRVGEEVQVEVLAFDGDPNKLQLKLSTS